MPPLPDLSILFPPSLGRPKASARAELSERALAGELGARVSIHVTQDYRDLERRALGGEAHLVWAPAGVCARIEPIARSTWKVVRHGVSTYRSALVARADDGVTLDGLRGLRAAWVDRFSLGGYVLAADLMRRRGLDPDLVFASQTFFGSHPEALKAVGARAADVTAVTAWTDDEASLRGALSMHVGGIERRLSVIAMTDEAPTDAMVLTTKLAAAEADAIAARLFPAEPGIRVPSFLPSAMGAEGFVRARPDEYRPLLRLLRL